MNRSKSAGNFRVRLAVLAVLAPSFAMAAPVIPGASGFGVETAAGRGGVVHRVTNLNASGSGSLAACVQSAGPRVCVFEVAGTIQLTQELEISQPFVTVAGQTAPSPGITLRGAGLLISASDVLVQHIKVRVGDDWNGPAPDNRDALKIESPVALRSIRNVVVDHCSFSWSVDEMASIWEGASNVSLLNNIFAEPLNYSIHPADSGGTEPHGYGVIIGPSSGGVNNISMIGNLMAHQLARNPLSYASFALINNVVYNYGDSAVEVANLGGPTSSSIVGNVFLKGVNSSAMAPVFVRGSSNIATVLSGTRVFISDTSTGGAAVDAWAASFIETPVTKSMVQALSTPLWPSGLVAKATSNNGVLDSVLVRAGARPGDRDSVDSRVVSQVRNRTGEIINCVAADGSSRCAKNAGGWPAAVTRTRALTLPANPNQVNSDGYTNLEKWLQQMAAEVEGASAAISSLAAPDVPTPPSSTQLL